MNLKGNQRKCIYCGNNFDPRGLKHHEKRCPNNPDAQMKEFFETEV